MLMRYYLHITSFFAVLIFVIAAPSQTPTPTPGQDESVIKISTNLIQIDATVLDRSGKVATGLTGDDFEIFENGKKQKITNFSFVDLRSDRAGGPVASSSDRPPNRPRPEQVHRTIALLVDDLGLSFSSTAAVKTALKTFVDEQMQPDDLVTILRTSAGSAVLQQFTSDKNMLHAAINRIRWYPLGTGDVGTFRSADVTDDPRLTQIKSETFTAGTLGAVTYVINGMSRLPGRKAVILFSDGLQFTDTTSGSGNARPISSRIEGVFRRLADLATRASVVIYGVDVRGLVIPMPEAGENISATGGGGKFGMAGAATADEVYSLRGKQLFDTQQGLKLLAEQTGGFAIVNKNDISEGVSRVLNDQEGYYLIAYQPEDSTFDSNKIRFNKIAVKIKRPDLKVRFRSGFYSVQDEARQPRETPREKIIAALFSPLNTGDIDLQLTSLFANDHQSGNFMRSLVFIDGKNLRFSKDPGGWERATFDVVAMIFGDDGHVVDQVSRTENIKAHGETLDEIRNKGFVATLTFPIKTPGSFQMRVVVRDTTSSLIGSASQFIEVPDLKKGRLTLSGLLLQRVSASSAAAQTEKPFQPDELRDVAIRSFRAGTEVQFGFAAYNLKPNRSSGQPHASVQYKLLRDGKEAFASKEEDIDRVETESTRLVAQGKFVLDKSLPKGDYVLQIIVKDLETGEKPRSATQWIDLKVTD
jgi:VWFA-related protein